jgi:hypothetical protein
MPSVESKDILIYKPVSITWLLEHQDNSTVSDLFPSLFLGHSCCKLAEIEESIMKQRIHISPVQV